MELSIYAEYKCTYIHSTKIACALLEVLAVQGLFEI